ncbi:MAG: restriction endonuclease subunit S [Thermodesulfobacteriota bacterium]
MSNQKEFKQTEVGRIPKDWEVLRLWEISDDIYYGITAKAVRQNTGLRMLRTTDIKNYSADWNRLPFVEITEKRNNLDKYLLKKGDLIVARAGTVGVSVLVEKDFIDTIFGSYLIKVKPKKEINPKFLHYFCQSKMYWWHLQGAQGSTLKNINLPLLKSLILPFPPLSEQKKIAEILSTVDQAIEEVGEAIEKTQRLKKGLMQTLLTKGIQKGRFKIQDFKDTEIGRIPKEWEVTQLKDAVEINKESIDPTKEFPNKRFLYIDIDSVENEAGVIKKAKEILGKDSPSRARRVIHYNDVIMSTVRPYLKAFAIIPKEFHNQICSTGFAVLSCKQKIIPLYLLYSLFSNKVINQCNKMMVGGQYPALNSSQLEKIKLSLPPLDEQQKIAEIFCMVDKRLELLRKRKERLERVKKGLMEDLLTGKKRVEL